ncbi:hypothetical protein FOZ60_016161 [Perkinsus olseni]|uniref:Uncharacterized protein n=1 Tax=Perkinsus olseni TaxID=32597 RepID=A0A7J6P4U8_PEROL|nr:hypothetical protein FOZ60_016161 [Perkinsus olseni]
MPGEVPPQEYPEVREVLNIVCDDEPVVTALYTFLISGNIRTARAVASLSPAFIAASVSNVPAPEGKVPAVWKGTVASLLNAARDEAADQLEVQVAKAKRDLAEPPTPAGGKSTSQRRKQSKLLTSSMKILATKLGDKGLPASLVPPQKMFDCLCLNLTAFVDFTKFMAQTSDSSSASPEGVLAEDLEGRPILIKSTSTSQKADKQQHERNFSAKWCRVFWWFAIALLSVQEALHAKDDCEENTAEGLDGGLVNVEPDAQAVTSVTILDLLQYFHKVLWYASEYNWSTAIVVDRNIRMAIEDACRGGTRTLADCYHNLDMWSAKASEAAILSMNSVRFSRYPGTDTSTRRGWSESSTYRLSSSTPSRQGQKRAHDNRSPASIPPPPKQQFPGGSTNNYAKVNNAPRP